MKRLGLFLAAVAILSSLMFARAGTSDPAGPKSPASLSYADRLLAQEKIERVYYSHQEGARQPFEEAVPASLIERKVSDTLKQSEALERYWGSPVTEEALDREVRRMIRTTRLPERLHELFAALDDDPVKIRECLARPVLVSRLLRNFYASDPRFHAASRADAESLRFRLIQSTPRADRKSIPRLVHLVREGAVPEDGSTAEAPGLPKAPGRQTVSSEELSSWRSRFAGRPEGIGEIREEPGEFTVPVQIEDRSDELTVAIYSVPKKPLETWWKEIEADFDPIVLPVASQAPAIGIESASSYSCNPAGTWDGVNLSGAPVERNNHTAVWTGSLMIVWGGTDFENTVLGSGGRYDPATDTWEPISTLNAPEGRTHHSAVWTGSRMIVWGGFGATTLASGGVYDPSADTWTPTQTTGSPVARQSHSAVWTGGEMLIWGGVADTGSVTNTGGRYNPATNLWSSIPTSQAPSARQSHIAVWTGARMVIWGGVTSTGQQTNTGARYDPVGNAWQSTETNGAPAARQNATAVWSGTRMIVWGGLATGAVLNTGGRYDPVANSWTAVSTTGAPPARELPASVWTGARMVIWGGRASGNPLSTGGRYDPATDSWSSTSGTAAPVGRFEHSAIWTGARMIVWGGIDSTNHPIDSGGRYDPAGDSWTPTAQGDAPVVRLDPQAIWTGNLMIVWEGDRGGRYDLSLNDWTPVSTISAPNLWYMYSMVWTGNRMIVWGGYNGNLPVNTGARYDPIADTWAPTTTTGAPIPRYLHTGVWSGSRMVVWGGIQGTNAVNTGGLYDPGTDSWQPTSLVNAPQARTGHTAVWTGSRMIVWGGQDWPDGDNYFNTGASYDPSSNLWTPISSSGAPLGRVFHSAVWTGSRMIVWGGSQTYVGCPGVIFLDTGGRYDPATDSWLPTSISPPRRRGHTAIWSGTPGLAGMIVYGGFYDTAYEPTFCSPISSIFPPAVRYDPISDSWNEISAVSEPVSRSGHVTVSTGNYMLVWGGAGTGGHDHPTRPERYLRDGGRFVLIADHDADGDGMSICDGDCNDGNPAIHPGALEVCDGLDDDCDSQIDEGFPDGDGDGYLGCLDDCNDANASIHPGATEICNGIDEDCDAVIDEGFDQDGDGYKTCSGDCNDANAAIHPGAAETCNGIDEDCDAVIDEGFDQDGDGYKTCTGDCNDANPTVHPGAAEVCNQIDDNCNGSVDEGHDQDGDGYSGCINDCDDANASVHPFAAEACNQVDDDCDGTIDDGFDQDSDGFTTCAGDCNDGNATVHPGAPEICDDLDDNCNGVVEDNQDLDGDGVTVCLQDCNDADPAVWGAPVEEGDLALDSSVPTNLTWFGQNPYNGLGGFYDLVSGTMGPTGGINTAAGACLQSSLTQAQYADNRPNPPRGTGAWYLVRARNSCGAGTYGASTGGQDRVLPSCP
ncbi:MAG TPA: MopE-related protein [Candidatus Polarisedimenticolia bacterium]|nr:MopE-related protein [Candidatus Polarisedimenticolia bacterium]